ncbi:MAG: hypothetical protein IPL87_03895 [Candidatus Moraniibacteriota bacterium]|nr:MAG: hypothetical protein IPL87_03895 [Candidatus Moranbacteria bacterium]
MNRHFAIFQKRVSGFLESQDSKWFLDDIKEFEGAVIVLLVLFFRQNVAIGRFARANGLSERTLAENEVFWLINEEGSFAFMKRHAKVIKVLQKQVSEEQLLQARIYAQCILFHTNIHCYLLGRMYQRPPSEGELSGDTALQTRWSFRLLLGIISEAEYRARLAAESQNLL